MKSNDKFGRVIAGAILVAFGACGALVPNFFNVNLTLNGVYQAAASQTCALVVEGVSALIGALLIASYCISHRKMKQFA